MHVLVERRYIFKRRSAKGRYTMAALAVALTGLTVQVAEAKPNGGYKRDVELEATTLAAMAAGILFDQHPQ
ncbi:MAG: hypothetical protein AAGH41_11565 [Pseudomonadota bacterium]